VVALMAVAALVAVLQLGVVGSWVRSVRLSTLVQAVAVGFLVCGPVTLVAQWALTRALASKAWPLGEVVRWAA